MELNYFIAFSCQYHSRQNINSGRPEFLDSETQ